MSNWQPTPVPLGPDPSRHDIGDDTRVAIVRRLIEDFARGYPAVDEETRRQMAMLAAASVRALLAELSVLKEMGAAEGTAFLSSRAAGPQTPTFSAQTLESSGAPAPSGMPDWMAQPPGVVPSAGEQEPAIACPLCGETVRQVASATLDLALWQHVNWTCQRKAAAGEGTDLRAWVQHLTDCELRDPEWPDTYVGYVNLPDGTQRKAACTCGLEAALATWPAPPPEAR